MKPRSLLSRAAVAVVATFAAAVASAQGFPDRPIKLIIPQPAGGGSDTLGRIWAECAALKLGRPVIVENRGGANGVPAINILKAAPADGYTVFFAGMSQMTITPYVFTKQPYDPLADFEGVSLLLKGPLVLVASTASNIKQFSDIAKAAADAPSGLSIASPGNGSPGHLLGAALADRLKVRLTHVPFQGEAAPLTQLLGGHVPLLPVTIGTVLPHVKEGRVQPLVIFDNVRHPQLPGVPTIKEVLKASDLGVAPWAALIAKAGTPKPAIDRIHAATQQCLTEPETMARFAAAKVSLINGGPQAVNESIVNDTKLWKPIIQQLGLRND
jgi:tripartite-type tricarboxylate transporter receptor subunit TctC